MFLRNSMGDKKNFKCTPCDTDSMISPLAFDRAKFKLKIMRKTVDALQGTMFIKKCHLPCLLVPVLRSGPQTDFISTGYKCRPLPYAIRVNSMIHTAPKVLLKKLEIPREKYLEKKICIAAKRKKSVLPKVKERVDVATLTPSAFSNNIEITAVLEKDVDLIENKPITAVDCQQTLHSFAVLQHKLDKKATKRRRCSVSLLPIECASPTRGTSSSFKCIHCTVEYTNATNLCQHYTQCQQEKVIRRGQEGRPKHIFLNDLGLQNVGEMCPSHIPLARTKFDVITTSATSRDMPNTALLKVFRNSAEMCRFDPLVTIGAMDLESKAQTKLKKQSRRMEGRKRKLSNPSSGSQQSARNAILIREYEECHHCQRQFKNLFQHSRVHSGVLPYTCAICREGSYNYQRMKTHILLNHSTNILKQLKLNVDPVVILTPLGSLQNRQKMAKISTRKSQGQVHRNRDRSSPCISLSIIPDSLHQRPANSERYIKQPFVSIASAGVWPIKQENFQQIYTTTTHRAVASTFVKPINSSNTLKPMNSRSVSVKPANSRAARCQKELIATVTAVRHCLFSPYSSSQRVKDSEINFKESEHMVGAAADYGTGPECVANSLLNDSTPQQSEADVSGIGVGGTDDWKSATSYHSCLNDHSPSSSVILVSDVVTETPPSVGRSACPQQPGCSVAATQDSGGDGTAAKQCSLRKPLRSLRKSTLDRTRLSAKSVVDRADDAAYHSSLSSADDYNLVREEIDADTHIQAEKEELVRNWIIMGHPSPPAKCKRNFQDPMKP